MSSNTQPLSNNPLAPLLRSSINSLATNVILDSDTGNSSLVVKTGTTNSLYIDKYSNVGINTGSPGAQLEVASANGACLRLRYGTTPTAYSNIFMASNGNLTISSNSGLVNITSPVTLSSDLTVNGNLTVTSGDINAALAVINPNAIGYVAASKAMIVDNSLSITGINNIGVTTIQIGSSTLNATTAGYITGLTVGTASASKALVLDPSKNISGINSLSATQLTGQLQSNEQLLVTKLGTLTELSVSGAVQLTSTTDAINVSNGGALTIAGGASIAKSVYIGGNLYVQGTTTTVESTVVSIKDNTILLNAAPVGPYDSGFLIERYQTSNDSNIGSVITDTAALVTTVISATASNVILSAGSTVDNFYQGWWVRINNQIRKVASYVGSSKTLVVASNFTIIPINSDVVNLFNKPFSGIVWNETNKFFQTICTAYDGTTLTVQERAALRTGSLISDNLSASTLSSSGLVSFTDATEASSTSIASVVLSGGLGIAKALRVGNGIYGTIQTISQPNITSLGILTSLGIASTASTLLTLTNTQSSAQSNIKIISDSKTFDIGVSGSAYSPASTFYIYDSSIGANRLIIDSTGNVGIGLSTIGASYKLAVNGLIYSQSGYTINTTTVIDASRNASFATATLATTLTIGSTTIDATELGYLDSATVGTISASKVIIADSNKAISGLTSLTITNTVPSSVVYSTLTSDAYSFTNGIQGSSTTVSANSYYWYYNGAYRLFMNPSGKIALGFTVPTGSMFDYDLGVNGTVNATNYYWNGSVVQLNRIQTPVAGVASASSALILDASLNINGINSLSATSITIGSNTLTSTQAGFLTGITAGTASASKALVVDANRDIINLNTVRATAMYVNNYAVMTTGTTAFIYVDNAIVGTAMPTTAMITDSNNEIGNVHAMGFADNTTTGVAKITFTSDAYTMAIGLRGSANISGNNIGFLSFNGADRLIVDTAGNFSIGTQSIGTYKLNINGSINATSYYVGGVALSLSNLSVIDGITNGTAAANKALVLDASLNITGINSLTATTVTVGTSAITQTLAGYLNIAAAGTAEASKVLVLNSSKDISSINSISTTSITIGGNVVSSEAAFLSGAQAGTAIASKVLVLDASSNITGIGSMSMSALTLNGTSISSTMIGYINGITIGVATAGKALVVSDPAKNISGLGQVSCSELVLGGNVLTADQFTYVNNLVPGVITPNRAVVIGPNYEASFGTSSIVFENNMFNIKLSNDSPTNYAIVQRWTNFITGDDLITDISFSNYACRFGTYSNHAMRIITNNSTKIYIDTLGNVGIGNNNPAYMLDVTGPIRCNQLMIGTSTDMASGRLLTMLDSTMAVSATKTVTLGYSNTNNNQAELAFYLSAVDSANNRLDIGTKGNTSLMTVRFDGNIGIATTSPSYTLDVNGIIRGSSVITSTRSLGDSSTYAASTAYVQSELSTRSAITFSPTGFENTTDSQITYSGSTRVLSVAPTSSSFNIWIDGVKFTKSTTQTAAAHANSIGVYYYYFDNTGTLLSTTTAPSLYNNALVAVIYYYDASHTVVMEKRYTTAMNPSTRSSIYDTIGAYRKSGIAITGYSILIDSDNAKKFALTSGIIVDDDISIPINSLAYGGPYNVMYRIGGGGTWTWTTGNTVPYIYTGGYINFNQWTGSTWQMTQLAAGHSCEYYIVAVPSITSGNQIFVVSGVADMNMYWGQSVDMNKFSGLDLVDFPFPEYVVMYKMILTTSPGYSSSGKCVLASMNRCTDTRVRTTNPINHDTLTNVFSAASNVTYGHVSNDSQSFFGEKTLRDRLILFQGKSILTDPASNNKVPYIIKYPFTTNYTGLAFDSVVSDTLCVRTCDSSGNDAGDIINMRVRNLYTIDRIGISTTTPSFPLHVNAKNDSSTPTAYTYVRSSDSTIGFVAGSTALGISIYATGRVYCDAEVNIASDKRIKTNIQSLTDDYCDQLLNVEPRIYQKKRGGNTEIGFVAQELLKKNLLELVRADKVPDDEGYLVEMLEDGIPSHKGVEYSVNYTSVIPILLNIVKRNRKTINDLQLKIDRLSEAIAKMQ